MTRLAEFLQGRLLRFVLLCVVTYSFIAWFTEAPLLILFFNGIAMSTAAGVCVAYAPMLPSALISRQPSRGDLLGSGIFLVSLSLLGMRSLSFVARDLGWPGVYNTDWITGTVALGILGGLLHLWAPNAVEGRIPRRRWVSSGVLVAIGLFLTFLAWYAHARVGSAQPVELR